MFVFLWVPFLQESKPGTGGRTHALPLGYIFSCFMTSMTLGSILYTSIISLSRLDSSASSSDAGPSASPSESAPPEIDSHHPTTDNHNNHRSAGVSSRSSRNTRPHSVHERVIALHAKLSAAVCAASALAFLVSVADAREHVRFWAFCAFEACAGIYYPVQGMLRGRLITDEHRATVC